MEIVLYHNPRCSKSRQALALLEERGVAFRVVEYLKEPLTKEVLRSLSRMLGLASVRDMMRVKESEYSVLALDNVSDDDRLLDAIVQCPKLLERPIVVNGAHAVIGRPPENILSLL